MVIYALRYFLLRVVAEASLDLFLDLVFNFQRQNWK